MVFLCTSAVSWCACDNVVLYLSEGGDEEKRIQNKSRLLPRKRERERERMRGTVKARKGLCFTVSPRVSRNPERA